MTTEPSIERVEQALSELGREHRSPDGWEERVLASTRRRRSTRWAALGAAVAAAAAFLLWWSTGRRPSDTPLHFDVRCESDGEVVRSLSSVRLHDTLHASVRGGRYRAIWVYRGAQLEAKCPGSAGCTDSGGEMNLVMRLDYLGSHTVIGLSHDARLPEPGRGYDADLAAAHRAKAAFKREAFVVE